MNETQIILLFALAGLVIALMAMMIYLIYLERKTTSETKAIILSIKQSDDIVLQRIEQEQMQHKRYLKEMGYDLRRVTEHFGE